MSERLIINGEVIDVWKDVTGGISVEEDGLAIELPNHKLISNKNTQSFIVELTDTEEYDALSTVMRGVDIAPLEMTKCRIIIQILGHVKPERD